MEITMRRNLICPNEKQSVCFNLCAPWHVTQTSWVLRDAFEMSVLFVSTRTKVFYFFFFCCLIFIDRLKGRAPQKLWLTLYFCLHYSTAIIPYNYLRLRQINLIVGAALNNQHLFFLPVGWKKKYHHLSIPWYLLFFINFFSPILT